MKTRLTFNTLFIQSPIGYLKSKRPDALRNNFPLKFRLTIITLCFLPFAISAQLSKSKFEIKGDVGYFSDAHMAVSFSDNLFGHYTNVHGSGIYSLDALTGIGHSNFMAMISYGYEQLNAKHKLDPHFRDAYYITDYLAGVQYNYHQRKNYYVYSGLQLGLRTTRQTDFSERPKNRFAYDATFVGVRYGKQLGAFFENGFGAKGFVRAGISYKF